MWLQSMLALNNLLRMESPATNTQVRLLSHQALLPLLHPTFTAMKTWLLSCQVPAQKALMQRIRMLHVR
tara:strand:- start:1050 stop:1256 length:207 start_codon:yes stop_codon:yes gene_type:complete